MMMTPNWYERAVEQLESDYADGLLTTEVFQHEMRELNATLYEDARAAANETYRDMTGDW